MKLFNLIIEFITIFAVVMVVTSIVSLLWNVIGDGTKTFEWETSLQFATIFGIILTWVKSREIPRKQS